MHTTRIWPFLCSASSGCLSLGIGESASGEGSLHVRGLPLGGLPPGVCLQGVSTMWPIPWCIWCYLYTVPIPTESKHQCSCLYSAGWSCDLWLANCILGCQPSSPSCGQNDADASENITLLRAVISFPDNSAILLCKWNMLRKQDLVFLITLEKSKVSFQLQLFRL